MANTNYSQLASRIAALESRIAQLEYNSTLSINSYQSMPIYSVRPIGCACPIGAEKTCNNPMCGRSGKPPVVT